MQAIFTLLLLLNIEQTAVEKTPVIDGAIAAVLLAFSVVVGVALERLLTTEAWDIASGYKGKQLEVFYWLVLTIGVPLAIRFLIGSYVHLHMTYAEFSREWTTFFCLLKDLIFLFVFGAFLVRMSFSKTKEEFLTWILIFSCADVLWCAIEVIIRYGNPRYGHPGERIAWSWLVIGLILFAVTALSRRSLQPEQVPESLSRNFNIFFFLAIVSLIVFAFDLWGILIGSGWTVFGSHPC
jgi:hypothetical protein